MAERFDGMTLVHRHVGEGELRRERRHDPQESAFAGPSWTVEYTIPPPSPYAGAEAPPRWAEQHRLQLSERSGVYFIACAGRIKIGVTTNIAKRFKAYQTMCPHEPILVALVRGDAREEAAIHRHFDDHWSHGEWFHMGAPLLEAVGRARRTGVWRLR